MLNWIWLCNTVHARFPNQKWNCILHIQQLALCNDRLNLSVVISPMDVKFSIELLTWLLSHCFLFVIYSIIQSSNYSTAPAALCIWVYSFIWSWQSGNQAIHWITHRFIGTPPTVSEEFFLRFYKSGWLKFMQNWNDYKGEHSNELAMMLSYLVT